MELNRSVDARAYALGVCDAFCEVVRAGVKRIALSHPFTQDELDTVLGADFIHLQRKIEVRHGLDHKVHSVHLIALYGKLRHIRDEYQHHVFIHFAQFFGGLHTVD